MARAALSLSLLARALGMLALGMLTKQAAAAGSAVRGRPDVVGRGKLSLLTNSDTELRPKKSTKQGC